MAKPKSTAADGKAEETNVKVIVRKRGLNARECDDGDAFGVVGTDTIICVNEQGRKGSAPPTQFSFHRVYDETATNESIYADSIATCVEDLVAGKNSTILAYGQTGSGKTYTSGTNYTGTEPEEERGMLVRVVADLFAKLQAEDTGIVRWKLSCSYVELYKEAFRDLLYVGAPAAGSAAAAAVAGGDGSGSGERKPPCMTLVRDAYGNYAPKDATVREITCMEDLASMLAEGAARRETSATAMNAHSSRSHAIFTVIVEAWAPPEGAPGIGAGSASSSGEEPDAAAAGAASADAAGTGDDADMGSGSSSASAASDVTAAISAAALAAAAAGGGGGVECVRRISMFRLVDLAGSERQSDTKAKPGSKEFKEAVKINMSLSFLGRVIEALVMKASHIPYTSSQLTKLLSNSLGGNCSTTMIACISPANRNFSQSISTLKYALKASRIVNKVSANTDPMGAKVLQLSADRAAAVGELARLYAMGYPVAPHILRMFHIGGAAMMTDDALMAATAMATAAAGAAGVGGAAGEAAATAMAALSAGGASSSGDDDVGFAAGCAAASVGGVRLARSASAGNVMAAAPPAPPAGGARTRGAAARAGAAGRLGAAAGGDVDPSQFVHRSEYDRVLAEVESLRALASSVRQHNDHLSDVVDVNTNLLEHMRVRAETRAAEAEHNAHVADKRWDALQRIQLEAARASAALQAVLGRVTPTADAPAVDTDAASAALGDIRQLFGRLLAGIDKEATSGMQEEVGRLPADAYAGDDEDEEGADDEDVEAGAAADANVEMAAAPRTTRASKSSTSARSATAAVAAPAPAGMVTDTIIPDDEIFSALRASSTASSSSAAAGGAAAAESGADWHAKQLEGYLTTIKAQRRTIRGLQEQLAEAQEEAHMLQATAGAGRGMRSVSFADDLGIDGAAPGACSGADADPWSCLNIDVEAIARGDFQFERLFDQLMGVATGSTASAVAPSDAAAVAGGPAAGVKTRTSKRPAAAAAAAAISAAASGSSSSSVLTKRPASAMTGAAASAAAAAAANPSKRPRVGSGTLSRVAEDVAEMDEDEEAAEEAAAPAIKRGKARAGAAAAAASAAAPTSSAPTVAATSTRSRQQVLQRVQRETDAAALRLEQASLQQQLAEAQERLEDSRRSEREVQQQLRLVLQQAQAAAATRRAAASAGTPPASTAAVVSGGSPASDDTERTDDHDDDDVSTIMDLQRTLQFGAAPAHAGISSVAAVGRSRARTASPISSPGASSTASDDSAGGSLSAAKRAEALERAYRKMEKKALTKLREAERKEQEIASRMAELQRLQHEVDREEARAVAAAGAPAGTSIATAVTTAASAAAAAAAQKAAEVVEGLRKRLLTLQDEIKRLKDERTELQTASSHSSSIAQQMKRMQQQMEQSHAQRVRVQREMRELQEAARREKQEGKKEVSRVAHELAKMLKAMQTLQKENETLALTIKNMRTAGVPAAGAPTATASGPAVAASASAGRLSRASSAPALHAVAASSAAAGGVGKTGMAAGVSSARQDVADATRDAVRAALASGPLNEHNYSLAIPRVSEATVLLGDPAIPTATGFKSTVGSDYRRIGGSALNKRRKDIGGRRVAGLTHRIVWFRTNIIAAQEAYDAITQELDELQEHLHAGEFAAGVSQRIASLQLQRNRLQTDILALEDAMKEEGLDELKWLGKLMGAVKPAYVPEFLMAKWAEEDNLPAGVAVNLSASPFNPEPREIVTYLMHSIVQLTLRNAELESRVAGGIGAVPAAAAAEVVMAPAITAPMLLAPAAEAATAVSAPAVVEPEHRGRAVSLCSDAQSVSTSGSTGEDDTSDASGSDAEDCDDAARDMVQSDGRKLMPAASIIHQPKAQQALGDVVGRLSVMHTTSSAAKRVDLPHVGPGAAAGPLPVPPAPSTAGIRATLGGSNATSRSMLKLAGAPSTAAARAPLPPRAPTAGDENAAPLAAASSKLVAVVAPPPLPTSSSAGAV